MAQCLRDNIQSCLYMLVAFLCYTLYSLLAVVKKQMLDLVDLWSNKCNYFNVLERLDLSKDPFF